MKSVVLDLELPYMPQPDEAGHTFYPKHTPGPDGSLHSSVIANPLILKIGDVTCQVSKYPSNMALKNAPVLIENREIFFCFGKGAVNTCLHSLSFGQRGLGLISFQSKRLDLGQARRPR